jgi:hypothetical protein
VKRPIELREQLMKNNELQRCLQHNIIYSIYCTICRKILCASCMYSSLQHRKHRVIPIENATEEIKEDLRSFSAKVPKVLQQCDGLSNSNSDYLVRMEREFNPILVRIQEFYDNLRGFLKLKEKEQLNALKEKRELLRAEVSAYNGELSKVQQYVSEKMKSYANTNIKPDLALPARNILENLMSAAPFVKDPQIDTESNHFQIDTDKFKVALEEIVTRIGGFVPAFESGLQRRRSFPRSIEEKQKSVSFLPESAKKDVPRWEKKKRMNSSVAGARTLRKY